MVLLSFAVMVFLSFVIPFHPIASLFTTVFQLSSLFSKLHSKQSHIHVEDRCYCSKMQLNSKLITSTLLSSVLIPSLFSPHQSSSFLPHLLTPNLNIIFLCFVAAPDGLSPPWKAKATSVSLNISWSAPAHGNAPGPLHYTLQMRALPQRPVIWWIRASNAKTL